MIRHLRFMTDYIVATDNYSALTVADGLRISNSTTLVRHVDYRHAFRLQEYLNIFTLGTFKSYDLRKSTIS